jgi:molecular chaperone Hsp33
LTDLLIRGELPLIHSRCFIVDASDVCSELSVKHSCKGLAREIFSKAITSGILVSPLLEGEERYTLRWQYDGELGTITADVTSDGGVRAYPHCSQLSSEIAVTAYGAGGKLGVVKSNPYRRLNSGMTLADNLDPALDLATYFDISDQIKTICDVVITGDRILGILLQALPKADPEHLVQLQDQCSESMRRLLNIDLRDDLALEQWASQWLESAQVPSSPWKKHQTLEPHLFCTCSQDKFLDILRGLPNEELEAMIREDGGTQIDCQFCAQSVRFEASDLQRIIQEKSQ